MPGQPVPQTDTLDLEKVTRELASAVSEAGEIALKMFREGCKSWLKDGHSPVTEADIAVDELLRKRLRAYMPSAGWLSEETVDAPERLERSEVFVVDPIDGTRAFVNKMEDWSISAALVFAGRPVSAALLVPVSGELYLATKGKGATRNGEKIAANMRSELAGARIGAPKNRNRQFEKNGITLDPVEKIHSLALRFARVSSGELDAALASVNSRDWDLAAADLIVHEAQGMLTTIHGAQPLYNRAVTEHPELAAAGIDLHPALLAALATGAGRNKGSVND
jgi:myo-inositol-1(or 4)-monophosphatase